MVAVTLDTLALDNPDGNGVRWYVESLDGFDSPPVRGQSYGITGVAGALPGEWVDDPRALQVRGKFYAPSESAMWSTMEALNNALPRGTDKQLLVATVLRTYALGYRVGSGTAPIIRPLTDRAVEFDLPLICLDPRKYASAASHLGIGPTSDATGAATQAGNFERTPPDSLTVTGFTGGATNFHLANSTVGQTLSYLHAIGSGEVLTVDFRAGTVTSSISGDVSTRMDSASRWWDLVAGPNVVHFTTDGGSAAFDLAWRNAWK